MDAQDIANLLTLCLGGATVWLGFETRRMARATNESVELQSRPYLSIHAVDYTLGVVNVLATGRQEPAIRLGLVLENPGQVLITYEVETIAATFEGIDLENMRFETRGGPIHPKARTTFRCPWLVVPNQPRPGQGGTISCHVNFWSSLTRVNHVTARLQYTLQGNNASRIEWLWLDGPSYA